MFLVVNSSTNEATPVKRLVDAKQHARISAKKNLIGYDIYICVHKVIPVLPEERKIVEYLVSQNGEVTPL
jgi:hypothetical protein